MKIPEYLFGEGLALIRGREGLASGKAHVETDCEGSGKWEIVGDY